MQKQSKSDYFENHSNLNFAAFNIFSFARHSSNQEWNFSTYTIILKSWMYAISILFLPPILQWIFPVMVNKKQTKQKHQENKKKNKNRSHFLIAYTLIVQDQLHIAKPPSVEPHTWLSIILWPLVQYSVYNSGAHGQIWSKFFVSQRRLLTTRAKALAFSVCLRNAWPSPLLLDAPSIKPGRSATRT